MSVEGLSNGIFIDDGTNFSLYECYIDTEYIEYPTNDVSCTIVGQHSNTHYIGESSWLDSSENYYSFTCSDSGRLGNISGQYNTYWLKFTTPNFDGDPIKATFDLKLSGRQSGTNVFNCAICTSDVNYEKYFGKVYPVDDQYQILSGTFTLSVLDDVVTLSIKTSSLNSNTTYYLVIWAVEVASAGYLINSDCANHSVIISCEDVNNPIYGSKFEKYVPYIDNGTSWEIIS